MPNQDNLLESRHYAGTRVQACDRDLPSLEQRLLGSTPQLLEEAITDAEGQFRIAYTLEQFKRGKAENHLTLDTSKDGADISFRVFDQRSKRPRTEDY